MARDLNRTCFVFSPTIAPEAGDVTITTESPAFAGNKQL
jgi:hypothetical protein